MYLVMANLKSRAQKRKDILQQLNDLDQGARPNINPRYILDIYRKLQV